jgi:hypothetical protein
MARTGEEKRETAMNDNASDVSAVVGNGTYWAGAVDDGEDRQRSCRIGRCTQQDDAADGRLFYVGM